MARMRFEDSDGTFGELDLEKVKAGDLVKFKTELVKKEKGDDTEKRVSAGETGEVLEVYPMMPGVLLEVPCELTSMGSRITGETELVVAPDQLILLTDARDPRTSTHRIDAAAAHAAASPSPDQLQAFVGLLGLPSWCLQQRRIVIAAFTRRGFRGPAGVLARTTDDAWTDYILGAGLAKTAALRSDWLPLIMWSLDAFGGDFPGAGKPNLRNRRHVVWALEQNAEDIGTTIPAHPVDWTDEDEQNSQLVDDMMDLKKLIQRSSDTEWVATLPQMAELMDPDFEGTYRKMLGLPPKAGPVAPSPPPREAPPPTPPPAPPSPAPIPQLNEPEPEAPLFETEPTLGADEDDLGDIVLEEPGRRAPPRSTSTDRARDLARDMGLSGRPSEEDIEQVLGPEEPRGLVPSLPPTPSKYDVAVGYEESEPHAFATPPPARARVPIAVFPGYEGQKLPRSVKVWAEPEMIIQNKNGETGAIVDFLPGDRLAVDVRGPGGLPASDEPAIWEVHDVTLSPEWEYPVQKLSPHEVASWRQQRHLQQKEDRRHNGGLTTTISMRDLFAPAYHPHHP